MDPLTIILLTVALAAFAGLAFIGGWELGLSEGTDRERTLANTRINGILRAQNVRDVVAYENSRKPKTQRAKRKAARRAVRV